MAYTQMAFYYDFLMKHAPYDEWVSFTEKIFKTYAKNVRTITDLGCGTGEITLRLAQLNYDMIGVDYSMQMLAIADQKSFETKQNIQWMKQDLRQLEGLANQDAMISYCDVMNYIPTVKDLKTVFKRVYEALSKDGIFIFDVHDYAYAKKYLMNQTFADVTDEFTYIWFCHEGHTAGEMIHELTFFAKNSAGTYERFFEIHEQQLYEQSIYEKLLIESGFKQVDVFYDFQLTNQANSNARERQFFVACKGSS